MNSQLSSHKAWVRLLFQGTITSVLLWGLIYAIVAFYQWNIDWCPHIRDWDSELRFWFLVLIVILPYVIAFYNNIIAVDMRKWRCEGLIDENGNIL